MKNKNKLKFFSLLAIAMSVSSFAGDVGSRGGGDDSFETILWRFYSVKGSHCPAKIHALGDDLEARCFDVQFGDAVINSQCSLSEFQNFLDEAEWLCRY